ncbi:MAG: outer membrane lipoprotein-sorting protein [Candidatus Neomarinimicrobiota bacterium]
MNKLFMIIIFIATAIIAQQATLTGQELIEKMMEIMTQENSKGTMTQTITTSSGTQRTFEFEMFTTDEGEKTLMRYLKPSAARGQAFLMLNNADDIWTYFPRTKRVRKLSSSSKNQKVQGSDFSFEDLGSGDSWEKEYTSNNLGSEKYNKTECWKIESIGIPEQNPSYPKMIVFVRKSDFYPLKIDYFDDNNDIEKTLFLGDIKEIEGVPTAMKMTMKNHLEGTETIMETLSITYNWEPQDNFFSERTLKK